MFESYTGSIWLDCIVNTMTHNTSGVDNNDGNIDDNVLVADDDNMEMIDDGRVDATEPGIYLYRAHNLRCFH